MEPTLRRPLLVEAICERLVQEHRRASWLPPERQLASDLGVSRPALREAIKRLENQGLLASRHGVGVQVVNTPHAPVQSVLERMLPDPAERVRQFTATRLIVEPALARLAATHATAQDLADLTAAHDRFTAATDLETAIAVDLEFHRIIARSADNQVLALMLQSMVSLEAESRRVTLEGVGPAAAASQHAQILQALLNRDATAASHAMQTHLAAAHDQLRSNASSSL